MPGPVARPIWWPLPDGEPIGEERARELLAYIREQAPAVIEVARAHIERRRPGEPVHTHAVSAEALARMALDRAMVSLPIGTVYAGSAGVLEAVSIGLSRNGWITANLSKATDPIQRWVSG